MNDLIDRAVQLAQDQVVEGNYCTVLILDGPNRHTSVRPGLPNAVWEAECAMDAAGATRAVLVVPLDDGEEELLHIVAVNLDWGIDVHRVRFDRDDEGVAFEPLETCRARLQLREDSPGYVLVQAMRAFEEDQAA